MERSFYDTVGAGSALPMYEGKAQTQEEKIKEYFRTRRGEHVTPEEVHESLFKDDGVPLGSIRRAFSNLRALDQGEPKRRSWLLVKTDKTTLGNFGVEVRTWKLPIHEKED